MEATAQVDERLRKLLLYVGEEGKQFESRDVRHLSTSAQAIIEKHIKLESELTPLTSLITKCIISIPQKQHLYALMTGHLSSKYEDRMNELINCVLMELQSSMNMLKETLVLNILQYLSQLMNFNILNSFIFISWLEAILAEAKKTEGKQKVFYLKVVIKSLPYCWKSLDQKMAQDFKKIMEKIDREADHLPKSLRQFWSVFYQHYNNKKLKDYSLGQQLRSPSVQEQKEQEQEFKQFNPSFKLSFKDRTAQLKEEVEVNLEIEEDDNLYRQFLQSVQAFLHKQNIIKILESFFEVKLLLVDKLKDYVGRSQNSFMNRFLVEILWKQAFKRPQEETIVFASVFSKLGIDSDEQLQKQYKRAIEDTSFAVFTQAQSFNLEWTEKFVGMISFYHANISNAWQWTRWTEQENMVNRHAILRLVFEKIGMLSDFKAPPEVSPFILPKPQPPALDQKQHLFEARIQDKLNIKADSDQIIPLITNSKQFTIFLDLLLGRMSNSMTHLKKLADRYKPVFRHFKYERQTISSIHSYWQHSQYHKIQYLSMFLQKDMISFEKFVEDISMRAKLSNSIDKILLRRLYERVKKRVEEPGVQQGLQTDLQQSLAL